MMVIREIWLHRVPSNKGKTNLNTEFHFEPRFLALSSVLRVQQCHIKGWPQEVSTESTALRIFQLVHIGVWNANM